MQHLQRQFRYKQKRVYGGTLNSVCQPSCGFTASSFQIRFPRRPSTALPYWHPESCDFWEFKIKAGRFGILREFAGNGSFKRHVQEHSTLGTTSNGKLENKIMSGDAEGGLKYNRT